jgi:limonene-1,2-epoxide hydrolase
MMHRDPPSDVRGIDSRGGTVLMGTSTAAIDTMIRDFFKAWERRDADYIASCFTDDAVYQNIPTEPIVGKIAVQEFLSGRADSPPPRIEIRHQVVSGNVVMNERVDEMTVEGRRFALPICGVFRDQGRPDRGLAGVLRLGNHHPLHLRLDISVR